MAYQDYLNNSLIQSMDEKNWRVVPHVFFSPVMHNTYKG